jgi:hypothetical protein
MTVTVAYECAWCGQHLRYVEWPDTPGVHDGDVSGAICADCARTMTREASRCYDAPRDAWLYQPQPWGLWAGVREGLFWVAMFVGVGVSVRLIIGLAS